MNAKLDLITKSVGIGLIVGMVIGGLLEKHHLTQEMVKAKEIIYTIRVDDSYCTISTVRGKQETMTVAAWNEPDNYGSVAIKKTTKIKEIRLITE